MPDRPGRAALYIAGAGRTGCHPQQRFKARRIGWGGNDQDILDACQHQSRQRVIDHGLIIHRQKLLGCDHGQRVQAGTSTAGEDDTFHDDAPFQ